jgi:hypothetical protein
LQVALAQIHAEAVLRRLGSGDIALDGNQILAG